MDGSCVDDLSSQLDDSMTVNVHTRIPVVEECQKHPRMTLYKNAGRARDQEKRWMNELATLGRKKLRHKMFDDNRSSLEESTTTKHSDHNTRPHPWAKKSSKYRGKSWRSYSIHLMLAEWLLFLPPNFENQYLMKICPKGRHVAICAAKGSTRVISRTGSVLLKTLSRLPGGGLGQSENQNKTYSTMLDCIAIHKSPNTHSSPASPISVDGATDLFGEGLVEFIVLDLIRYRNTCYASLSFRERSYWLEEYHRAQIEQFEENDPIRFSVIPAFQCDTQTMNAVLSEKPSYEVDGILFYHELVTYEPGATPLVSWLKPYMLPEWFPGLTLHSDYNADIPPDYSNYLNEIRAQEALARCSNKPHKQPSCDMMEEVTTEQT